MIILAEKGKNNKKLLTIENMNKTAMAECEKIWSAINLEGEYNWAISNSDIDIAENWGQINIKKYWRYAG